MTAAYGLYIIHKMSGTFDTSTHCTSKMDITWTKGYLLCGIPLHVVQI